MEENNKLAQFHKLLEAKPSEDAWWALKDYFLDWPKGQYDDLDIAAAKVKLEHWDYNIRQLGAGWMPTFHKSEANPICSLAGSVRIYRRSEGATEYLIKMSHSPRFSDLKSVIFQNSEIYSEGFEAFSHSKYLTNMVNLEFRKMTLLNEEIQTLSEAPNFSNVKTLVISGSGFGLDKLLHFFSSKYLNSLEDVDISHNILSDENAVEIVNRLKEKGIRKLNMERNDLTNIEELQRLCQPSIELLI